RFGVPQAEQESTNLGSCESGQRLTSVACLGSRDYLFETRNAFVISPNFRRKIFQSLSQPQERSNCRYGALSTLTVTIWVDSVGHGFKRCFIVEKQLCFGND